MEELFEKEMRLKTKHYEEDLRRLVICSQRCALNVALNHFREKENAIYQVTSSEEYHNIVSQAYGKRFTRLNEAWLKAFYKSSLYGQVADEINEIINNKFYY